MKFFLNINPPTVTAQEHKVMVRKGRPMFYDTPRLKSARALYQGSLHMHKPKEPFNGPVALSVVWYFPSKTHPEGEYRKTRPDTDNLQKLLKDCMTAEGFWNDDAQVCVEKVVKKWTRTQPGLEIEVVSLDE